MSKIKWKPKSELDAEKKKQEEKRRFKGKAFTTLSRKEKDELLMILLEEHGMI